MSDLTDALMDEFEPITFGEMLAKYPQENTLYGVVGKIKDGRYCGAIVSRVGQQLQVHSVHADPKRAPIDAWIVETMRTKPWETRDNG